MMYPPAGDLRKIQNPVGFTPVAVMTYDHQNGAHFKACETIFVDEHPSVSYFEVAQGKLDMIHGHMLRSQAGSSLSPLK